jgi:hypothetical protein
MATKTRAPVHRRCKKDQIVKQTRNNLRHAYRGQKAGIFPVTILSKIIELKIHPVNRYWFDLSIF